jgi:hypothetical protein
VQRGDPSLGAGDIDQLVDVLLEYSSSSHFGGSSGMASSKWLVTSSEAGSMANQHGAQ